MKRSLTRYFLSASALLGSLASPAFSQEPLGSPVAVEKPEQAGATHPVAFTGSITSERFAALSPRIAGLVVAADAEAGHEAKLGDTLVQLDDTLAKLALAESESELHRAQTELDEAKRRLQEAVDLGERNFPRTEREARAATVRLAEAAVAQIQTAFERQRELVERHKVVAPFDGVVQRKRAELGEWVQTGSPVLELVSVSSLRLDVPVPQEQLSLAERTTEVEVQVAGLEGGFIRGQVQAIAPAVDPGTRSFLVRIGLLDPPPEVRPGMSAKALFQPESEGPALLISRDAIIRSASGETQVWTVTEKGGELRAEARRVQLGETRGTRVVVLSGLSGAEDVVVRGNESLREGQLVRVVDLVAGRPQTGG